MSDYAAIIPIVIVVLSAALPPCSPKPSASRASACRSAGLGLIGLVGAAIASGHAVGHATPTASASSASDNFALFINLILCIVGILTMLFSTEVVEREGLPPGEYYALTLFAI